MSKELWIDIHDYSPPTNEEHSTGPQNTENTVITRTTQAETEEESLTNAESRD